MFESKTVAVVVPCFNEEAQIAGVLETMPDFVDCVIVVDDASTDGTAEVVRQQADPDGRVVLLQHSKNCGVGATVVTGYEEAVRRAVDVTAVMAGDGQMDPKQLRLLVRPVVAGETDYAKANRLFFSRAWELMPRRRYLGNAFLSMLTKIASGYWHVADSQTGFTAISLEALRTIDLKSVYKSYGYPNDLLVRLNVFRIRVTDVPVRPVYPVGGRSKMRLWKVIPAMSWLIWKRFWWRMWRKYVIYDFHPLVLFYLFGTVSFAAGFLFGLYLLYTRLFVGPVASTSGLFSMFLCLTGLQLLLFAMWFDMESNRGLR